MEPTETREPKYTSQQIVEETGLSYRQVDYWCRKGYFGEHHQNDHTGSGNRREFTAEERHLARQLAILGKMGLTPLDSLVVLSHTRELVSGEFQAALPVELGGVSLYWRLP